MERSEQWKKLCRDNGWLHENRVIVPEGHQLFFAFGGEGRVPQGEGSAPPGFFVASDPAQTSIKNASSTAQSQGDFIVAKPDKGYNVSIWTYYLWEDIVSIQLVKMAADRVV